MYDQFSWMNLKSNCTGVMKREVDSMRLTMHVTWSQLNFGATAVSEDMFQWIPRDFLIKLLMNWQMQDILLATL